MVLAWPADTPAKSFTKCGAPVPHGMHSIHTLYHFVSCQLVMHCTLDACWRTAVWTDQPPERICLQCRGVTGQRLWFGLEQK